jgi:hypothetical protein
MIVHFLSSTYSNVKKALPTRKKKEPVKTTANSIGSLDYKQYIDGLLNNLETQDKIKNVLLT